MFIWSLKLRATLVIFIHSHQSDILLVLVTMSQRTDTNIERLAIVVKSLTEANKALREIIKRGTGEVGQLEKFEDRFRDVGVEMDRFREIVQKDNKQAELLKSRLDQDIDQKRRYAESLRSEIEHSKREIDDLTIENERLVHETEASIKRLHDLKKNSDRISNIKTKSPQLFIQRLQNELE